MKKILLALLFLARLWLAVHAKHGDMYNNLDWGQGAATHKLSEFYELPKEAWPHSRPNQPPGSIFLHLASYQLNSSIYQTINFFNAKLPLFPSKLVWWWELHGELITIKLPSIIADFLLAAVIYKFTRRPLISIFYLLTPALWYNSSFWGQTDSVVAAIALTSLYFLRQKRLALSPIFFGLSLITKASWAPILPLYLLYFLKNHYRKFHLLLLLIIAPLIVSWPFHPHLDLPVWLANLYLTRLLPGESGFITVNAFNLWHLFFAPRAVSFVAANIGSVLVGLILCIALIRTWKKNTFPVFLHSCLLVLFGTFLFASRMHERYLYPVFPLLIISQRYLTYTVLSVTYFLNMYSDWWNPTLTWLISLYTPTFTKIISIVNLSAFTYEAKR